MKSNFSEIVDLTKQLFLSSTILQAFGEPTLQLIEKSDIMSRHNDFVFMPNQNRLLIISLSELLNDNHYFVVEIRKVDTKGTFEDAFLLDDWMQIQHMSLVPYPFILSTYSGSPKERLTGFVAFLEGVFKIDVIAATLRNQHWPKVLFNWGNCR